MKDQMVLLFYAEGSGDEWEALCIDFDIAVQGTSEQDVMKKLRDGVSDYVKYIHSLPEKEQRQFLNRRIPRRLQAAIFFKMLYAWFCRRRDYKERHSFSVPCAV
jgi:hypothetical protein